MVKPFTISFKIDSDELINELVQSLDPEEMIDFIRRMDKAANQWAVTLGLADYFGQLKTHFETTLASEGPEANEEIDRAVPTATKIVGSN